MGPIDVKDRGYDTCTEKQDVNVEMGDNHVLNATSYDDTGYA